MSSNPFHFTADELVELGHNVETTGRKLSKAETFLLIDTALEALKVVQALRQRLKADEKQV